MRQIVQHLGAGNLELMEVPCPAVRPGDVLIATRASVISAGTERMLVEFGRAGMISKARQQPERVRQALAKIRTDGLAETLDTIRSKLDQPLPLGYCNAGRVLEAGPGVEGFAPGDRVVSNGYHAEVVSVGKNLCAPIPDEVSDEAAAFTALGAIALQGVRLAQPTIGETFVVSGLGLVGLLAVQILRASGCRVMGLDLDPQRLALARRFGARTVDISDGDAVSAAMDFSNGGVDGVIIAASTASSAPVRDAARMCRKRGRIVLIGVTGLELSRADFYHKEISFQVSCSYGPGRYDSDYENRGNDYPIGFVRWTEQRNFQAVLEMLAEGKIDVAPLISHRFPLQRAAEAYDLLASGAPSLGVVIQYPERSAGDGNELRAPTLPHPAPRPAPAAEAGRPVLALVGPGSFASKVLLPSLSKLGVRLKYAVSANGLSSAIAARKFGFLFATTDFAQALADPEVNAVMIATRHDTHAALVCRALLAGKHVFVEKPLALNEEELREIEKASHARPGRILMVGFNRRFSPHARTIRTLLENVQGPKSFVMTVNAGELPPEHWTRDRIEGGGRIVGEACHFIDLLRFLAAAPVTGFNATALGGSSRQRCSDSVSFTLSFADGSMGTVHYLTGGHRSYPKERLQVFAGGRVLDLDNFRRLRGYGWPRFSRMNLWRQDKGHRAEMQAFVNAIACGGPPPIEFEDLLEVARLSFAAADNAF